MVKLTNLTLCCILSALFLSLCGVATAQAQGVTKKFTPQEASVIHSREVKQHRGATLPVMTTKEKPLAAWAQRKPFSDPLKAASRNSRGITAADGSKIFGCMIYNSTWTDDNQPAGIYSFGIGDGNSLAEVAVGDDYIANGGGVFANGKFYAISYMSFMGYIIADLDVIDFDTWTLEESIPVDMGCVARDMTYDPTTGNVYGCFFNDDADGWVFGRLDLNTHERTFIKDLDVVFVVIAANADGEVYGIDLYGDLYKFDKSNGNTTKIGNTGRSPAYSASGCFDLRTGKLYWECLETDAVARIFEVNTTDASVTLSTILPNSSELVSMFIPVPEADDAAPAAVADLTPNFEKDALSGNVTFTLPTTTYAGVAITGSLNYTLTINEEVYATGTAACGEAVTIPVTMENAGEYRFAVYSTNSVGDSPITKVTYWLGYDMPSAVSNLKLVKNNNDGEMQISWDAVSTTVHGGYINPAEITYDVVRYPDEKTVATNYTGTTITDQVDVTGDLTTYSYGVTVNNGYMKSLVAYTNAISVGLTPLPFYEPFEENGIDLFYVVDANNDGYTWTYDPTWESARIRYSSANDYNTPQDDWLFAPMMHLESGRLYEFSLNARCYMSSEQERFEVKLGKAQSVESMTQQVIPVTVVANELKENHKKFINVEESGNYSFGIHGCSLADKMYLYIDDVTVKEGPLLGTPNAVTGLTATAAAEGAYQATITFTTPKTTVDDNALKSITEVRIYRDGTLIKTYNNPSVGSKLTYVDEGAHQGNNTYTVIATNSIGDGFETAVTVFVGYDIPGVVSNVRAVDNDGTVTITWEAPTYGANGGYIDPEKLTYYVIRANDETTVARSTSQLSATDVNPPLGGYQQEFFAYYVYASSAAGVGDGVLSNIVPVGEPFAMPFKESFPNVNLQNDPWDVEAPESSEGLWKLVAEGETPSALPQDNDGGMVTFVPSNEGDSATLYSGKIDFTNANNPVLEFYYYYAPDCLDYMTVYLSVDGGEFESVGSISYRTLDGDAGWRKMSIELAKYASAKYIQIAFEAKSYDAGYNLHLDNIRIKNLLDYNLSVESFTTPSKSKVGATFKANVEVVNSGIVPATSYTVDLYLNGALLESKEGSRLMQEESAVYTFEVSPTVHFGKEAELYAVINWSRDEDTTDNTSERRIVTITQPNYPAVDDLEAVADDLDVTLTWDEPSFDNADGKPVTDGAESYKAFAISQIGDWTLVDGDKSETYKIGSGNNTLTYDNAGKPMAYMVFNPTKAGILMDDSHAENQIWMPHSGSQMFACFASTDAANDDWLISPELPAEAQEISFFVKSVFSDYPESYEVLYSTTDCETSDFIKIGGTRTAPSDWTEVKVVLPAGATYFAIHCVSNDQFVFAVDDIKYLPASAVAEELSLIGYNLYANNVKVNDEPIEELSYVHHLAEQTMTEYYVTVVYDKGESAMSNVVTVYPSSVNAIVSGKAYIYGGNKTVIVDNATGDSVNIFTLDGHIVAGASLSSDHQTFAVPTSGVYVVIVDKKAYKVIVK
jgi:hypothetical protein